MRPPPICPTWGVSAVEALVVGWKPLIEDALERLGVPHVTVTEMHKYAKALSHGHRWSTLLPCGDTRNIEGVLSALERANVSAHPGQIVFGTDEFNLVVGAAVAQLLGARGQFEPHTGLLFRDKRLQKERFRESGLACATNAVVTHQDDLDRPEVREIGFPAVVKPVAGAGTRHTRRVEDPAGLRRILEELVETGPDSGPFLLERYVPGSELYLDGCLRDGQLTTFGVSRYFTNNIDVSRGGINGAYVLDPTAYEQEYVTLRALAEQAVKALGLTDGLFHLEVFESPRGYVLSECAARYGGNNAVDTYELKFGLNLVDEHVRSLLGLDVGQPRVSPETPGRTLLRAPAGHVLATPSLDELKAQPGVIKGAIDVKVGERSPAMDHDSFTRAGSAVLVAPDESAIVAQVRSLREWFQDAVKVEETR